MSTMIFIYSEHPFQNGIRLYIATVDLKHLRGGLTYQKLPSHHRYKLLVCIQIHEYKLI